MKHVCGASHELLIAERAAYAGTPNIYSPHRSKRKTEVEVVYADLPRTHAPSPESSVAPNETPVAVEATSLLRRLSARSYTATWKYTEI